MINQAFIYHKFVSFFNTKDGKKKSKKGTEIPEGGKIGDKGRFA
jgi:hypothetical protein